MQQLQQQDGINVNYLEKLMSTYSLKDDLKLCNLFSNYLNH